MNEIKDIAPDVMDEITKYLRQVKYGEIVITLYDSRVVQIERREKKRFQNKTNATVQTG
ncbi:MAG: YezD family protein [Planctomycetota bacterium]